MAQSILHLLSQIRGGAALEDANRMLSELAQACRETGKKGKLTLTIEVTPDKTDTTILELQPDVAAKMPKRPYTKGLVFYDDATGTLTREDPRQLALELERKEKLADQGAAALSQVGRG